MWDPNKQSQQQIHNISNSNVSTSSISYPVAQEVNEWSLKQNYKNNPQSKSVGTASFIFISGGMSMAWNLGFSALFSNDLHIIISWFIGGIIGAIIGAIVCKLMQKKLISCFACVLVTISGILQVSDPHSYSAIIASRYINGIAVGLVFPLTIVLVGEEVDKSSRGANAVAVDTMSFSFGIFLQTIYSFAWPSSIEQSFSVMQINGVLNILWGFIGFIMVFILLIESPIFHLARSEEGMAVDVLRRLQRPFTITQETYEQLEEHKIYLAESKETNFIQSAIIGLPALAKLIFYRSFMALGFSFFLNYAFTYSCLITTPLASWPFYLYGTARWLGSIFIMFFIDSKGRKPPMISGFLVSGILALTVAGIFGERQNLVNISYMNAVKFILIFYQLFAPISMASSSVYLSEAFPLAVKPYYIAIVFVMEMLVHIVICVSKAIPNVFNIFEMPDYFYSLGSLSLAFVFVAIFLMPETKWNTLRECLTNFKKLISYKK